MFLYSGVKHQDKRDGGGAHNWGTVSDQIQYVGFAILIFITHKDFGVISWQLSAY